MGYPIAPLVTAISLGPTADENLRRGLDASHGNLIPFFTRPLVIFLMILTTYSFLGQLPAYKRRLEPAKRTFHHT